MPSPLAPLANAPCLSSKLIDADAVLYSRLTNAHWLHDTHLQGELRYLMKIVKTKRVSLTLISHKKCNMIVLRSGDPVSSHT